MQREAKFDVKHCLFAPCNGSIWTRCRENAIERIKQTSKENSDMYESLVSQKVQDGDEIWNHKGCYCTYTSTSRRKEGTGPRHALFQLTDC